MRLRIGSKQAVNRGGGKLSSCPNSFNGEKRNFVRVYKINKTLLLSNAIVKCQIINLAVLWSPL